MLNTNEERAFENYSSSLQPGLTVTSNIDIIWFYHPCKWRYKSYYYFSDTYLQEQIDFINFWSSSTIIYVPISVNRKQAELLFYSYDSEGMRCFS